jgi:hypothetical protein
MPSAAENPSIVAEVMRRKGVEKKRPDQAADDTKHTVDAP